MKRSQSVGWLITGVIIAAVTAIFLILMVLFTIPIKNPAGNSAVILNTALTSNWRQSQNSKDSSPQKDNEPSKKPEPVFIMQAGSLSNVNDSSIGTRQNTPFWERSLPIDEPLPILNFFIPVLVIRVFAMFYRLSRTGPGDDLPDRCSL